MDQNHRKLTKSVDRSEKRNFGYFLGDFRFLVENSNQAQIRGNLEAADII